MIDEVIRIVAAIYNRLQMNGVLFTKRLPVEFLYPLILAPKSDQIATCFNIVFSLPLINMIVWRVKEGIGVGQGEDDMKQMIID